MQASDFDHRCTEPTCCVYGQPTTTSCLCHKSREDMMLAALVAEKRAREDAQMELKRHFPVSKYNGLDIEQWKDRCMAAERVLAMAPMRWREKWFGSPPQKGSWIYADRDPVAFIGETEADHAECGKIVLAHNAALESAETHSAALARALEEARDELLECKADYHRNPSSVIDKCNAVLAEARTALEGRDA